MYRSHTTGRRRLIAGAAVSLAVIVAGVADSVAAPPAGIHNNWVATGAMLNGRLLPGTAVLKSGKVLFAGSDMATTNTGQTAEIYDPSSGTFAAAANMTDARTEPSALTLSNGDVLVAGGGSSPANASVELYNPTTNVWSAPVTISTHGQLPLLEQLPNGNVLIVGGGSVDLTVDIYNPTTNALVTSPTPAPLPTAAYTNIDDESGIELPNGKFLLVGGLNTTGGTAAVNIAYLYDPTANTWTATGSMNAARALAGVSVLSSGKVLVAGGASSGGSTLSTLASTETYDPSTGTFTSGPSMTDARVLFSETTLNDGRVLVTGGAGGGSGSTLNILSSTEIYDPATNTWSSSGSPGTIVGAGIATLPNGQVLLAGGESTISADAGAVNAEVFTPDAKPTAPGVPSAVAGNGQATVTWTPPADNGGDVITSYTVTSSTGQTATTPDGRTSAVVTGLTNGTSVTFTVTATNARGVSPASSASTGVTPVAPTPTTVTPPPDTPATLTVGSIPSKVMLKALLKGLSFSVTPSKAVSLKATLMATAKTATIARATNLTLASQSFGSSTATAKFKLKPSTKLLGHPRKATLQVVIVATDAAGTTTTVTRSVKLKG